jgi:hypothetical protein
VKIISVGVWTNSSEWKVPVFIFPEAVFADLILGHNIFHVIYAQSNIHHDE